MHIPWLLVAVLVLTAIAYWLAGRSIVKTYPRWRFYARPKKEFAPDSEWGVMNYRKVARQLVIKMISRLIIMAGLAVLCCYVYWTTQGMPSFMAF